MIHQPNQLKYAFSAVSEVDAKVLILGSMPGEKSLQDQQYYAHARNAFWSIMEALFHIDRKWSYEKRLHAVCAQKIALWDVLQCCQRQGSLDSAICKKSEVANDFSSFFIVHPDIQYIFFNGKKAQQSFLRHVWPTFAKRKLQLMLLPSSSPAMAMLNVEEKMNKWTVLKDVLL